jgi:hypothetical protein
VFGGPGDRRRAGEKVTRAIKRAEEADLVPVSRLLSWAFLLGHILLVAGARGAYAAYGLTPSAPFEILATLGLMTFIWYWVTQECERCGAAFPLDFAWFLAILWFALVPYYLWRFQRWRGVARCLIVSAWYLGAWVVSLVVYYSVAGRR